MENISDFEKRRRRGLNILLVNEFIAVVSLYYLKYNNTSWIKYTLIGYAIISTILLFNRALKNKPSDNDDYIFGKTLGNKMNSTPQKFILEAMLMSLSFIILTGIASSIYSISFTEIDLVYKIIIGISGFFGAIFMTAILISTFIQYKQLMEVTKLIETQPLDNSNNPFDIDINKKEVKINGIKKTNSRRI
jgi:predicted CDP-diglyceride synthetase/phosphatidate cytidylyltransferase